ncbi:MAG TPA: SCO family protein [Candidatus Aquilonibacter sp.]|nr:SCO family protein [Candidatus Aquilonibacter sp.]
MVPTSNRYPRLIALLGLAGLLALSVSCKRSSSTQPKRYSLIGTVVSIDKNAGTANVDNQPIKGFMERMVMPYTIKPPEMLNQLKAGDTITADVVVEPDKYWLENVKVTGHSQLPANEKPAADFHMPNPGDDVPDFKLVNQSGRTVSLDHYRGETLLLTLIYTRCPFPDYCPRVSHEFAAIDKQIQADPARYGKTHLLSISFDPVHDTPNVLRAYGFSCAGSKNPALFKRWEFAAIPKAELPEFAHFFALTYQDQGATIIHSLSTAVISGNGKIFKWYHGADWQASDVLQDVAAAHAAS